MEDFAKKSMEKGLYFVAVKLLLRDGDKLLITHDIFDAWDIPGGRMKPHEFGGDIKDVLRRKMIEELGDDLEYEIAEPVVFFQVERQDYGTTDISRIVAIGFEGKYLGGDIVLGEHHDKYEWVDVKKFKPEEYFTGGWLKGVAKYQKI